MELISVIIPVYNVEAYIARCLDSVINQTYKNIEIILVNDGSNDNSGKICDEYAAKDKRIVVIHQKNMGVTHARLTGVKKSLGNLVMFIDSDDYVDADILKKMYFIYDKYCVDIVSCQYFDDVDGNIKENAIRPNIGYYDKKKLQNLLKYKFLYDYNTKVAGITGYLCTRLIKKSFLIPCLELGINLVHSEDQIALFYLLSSVDSMYVMNERLYFYVAHKNQVTKAYNYKLWNNFSLFLKILHKIDDKKFLENQISGWAFLRLRLLIKMELKNNVNFIEKIRRIKSNFNNELFQIAFKNDIKNLNAKEKLQFYLLKNKKIISYTIFFYINKTIKFFQETLTKC